MITLLFVSSLQLFAEAVYLLNFLFLSVPGCEAEQASSSKKAIWELFANRR